MFVGKLNSDFPAYIITDDTTEDEIDAIDPFSHIIHRKAYKYEIKGENDKLDYQYLLKCQFLDCNDCAYNELNEETSTSRNCKETVIKDMHEAFPELLV